MTDDKTRPPLLRVWLGLRDPVSRGQYVAGGVLFMLLKFVIERVLFAAWGRELSPIAFLSPSFVHRAELLRGAPDGATWTMIGLALPFLWIGVSMSVRRALDAGVPPLLGFLFLIPGVHYLLMAALCALPSKPFPERDHGGGAYRPPPEQAELPREPPSPALRVARSVLASAAVGFFMFGVCVYALRSYGAALFLATPFVMGMIAALSYQGVPGAQAVPEPPPPASLPDDAVRGSRVRDRHPMAFGCGILGLAVVGIGLLSTAAEGGACIAMALVPAGLLSILGSLLAVAIGDVARHDSRVHRGLALFALPLAAGAESAAQRSPLYEVVSTVEVDAPPEVVFASVVSFPDLAPPTELLFRGGGVAYPVRARIDGSGVGATRYCEFSTGTFVEPITRWEAPTRLSFDVAESPPPMREWSFWDHVDAPHLHGFMRSKRGEFRLVALPGGRTRLEGSTFYELEIYPELYWKAWTDAIVHAVHGRVLGHIKQLSEREAQTPAPSDGAL